jgi:NAD(P)H dehydrogenase (quinone)
MSKSGIVVTGATGNIGSRVVRELAARQKPVTAFVRDARKAAELAAAGAELREGSFEHVRSLGDAFSGADTLVLITSGASMVEQARVALEAARAAGVRRVIRVSSLKAATDAPVLATRRDGAIEALIQASSLTAVVLRGHCFMQNLLHHAHSIRTEGKIYFGTGSGKIGMIDSRDIADAAVAAAISQAWDGRTLELTGPESVDFHTVAATLARALERDVAYVPVPPAAVGATARQYGVDDDTARVLTDYCTAYASGWGDFTTDNVAQLTGHAPRSLEVFVREILVPAIRAA